MNLTWLDDLLNNPVVLKLIVFCLILSVAFLWVRIKELSYKYNQHDKILFVVSDKLVPHLIHVHRNGDYELVNPLNRHAEQASNIRRPEVVPSEKEDVPTLRPEVHGVGLNGKGRGNTVDRSHKATQQTPETSL